MGRNITLGDIRAFYQFEESLDLIAISFYHDNLVAAVNIWTNCLIDACIFILLLKGGRTAVGITLVVGVPSQACADTSVAGVGLASYLYLVCEHESCCSRELIKLHVLGILPSPWSAARGSGETVDLQRNFEIAVLGSRLGLGPQGWFKVLSSTWMRVSLNHYQDVREVL